MLGVKVFRGLRAWEDWRHLEARTFCTVWRFRPVTGLNVRVCDLGPMPELSAGFGSTHQLDSRQSRHKHSMMRAKQNGAARSHEESYHLLKNPQKMKTMIIPIFPL